MPSNAEQLFQKIVGDEAKAQTAIETMVGDKTFENELLDYKGGIFNSPNDMKKLWSKALSAFANTGGGVVVWGVDCRKEKDPSSGLMLDQPTGLKLSGNATALAQQLSDFLLAATADAVEGVVVHPVAFGKGLDGCVVCLIPEGRNKPYRAMFADNKYYMRMTDRMAVIPHSLLRSLFYPRVAAELEVWVTAHHPDGPNHDIRFDVTVKNVGNATAKDTYVRVQLSSVALVVQRWADAWQEVNEVISPLGYCADMRFLSVRPIHPTFEQKLGSFNWAVSNEDVYENRPMILTFEVYLHDGEAKMVAVQFSPQEMVQSTRRMATPVK